MLVPFRRTASKAASLITFASSAPARASGTLQQPVGMYMVHIVFQTPLMDNAIQQGAGIVVCEIVAYAIKQQIEVTSQTSDRVHNLQKAALPMLLR